ncbi:MAG TPA: aminoglycoside phosphotransferase family protein [Pseudonocardia sp.]|nr:aminoglycoside phosphotransferase family protein [Pseudonocardia sp.]
MSASPAVGGLPADESWLPSVRRWVGAPVTVLGRRDLAGGYVSDAVRRVDLDADGRRLAVVVKRAGTVEIAAMRALAEVPGVPAPRLLAAGPDWIVLPFYSGSPPADGVPVASEVFDVLGRVHTHWRDRCPPGVPVVDAGWWARLCEWTLVAVRGGLARTGDPRFAATADALDRWRTDSRIAAALDVLPRTLCHGDPHRGNLLAGPDGTVLIDWGNARFAPAALDLAVLAAQDASPPPGHPDPGPLATAWGTLQAHVQYLGFAADHLGPARVAEMTATAVRALTTLGRA